MKIKYDIVKDIKEYHQKLIFEVILYKNCKLDLNYREARYFLIDSSHLKIHRRNLEKVKNLQVINKIKKTYQMI